MTYLRRRELPPLLRAIHDPPARLYLRGSAEGTLLALPAVAIGYPRDQYGIAATVKVGREQREQRFPPDTAIKTMEAWRLRTHARR